MAAAPVFQPRRRLPGSDVVGEWDAEEAQEVGIEGDGGHEHREEQGAARRTAHCSAFLGVFEPEGSPEDAEGDEGGRGPVRLAGAFQREQGVHHQQRHGKGAQEARLELRARRARLPTRGSREPEEHQG